MLGRTLISLAVGGALAGLSVTSSAVAPPRRGYIVVEPPDTPDEPARLAAGTGAPVLFYLNRNGGTYLPGSEDAATNHSSILDAPSTIPPWDVSPEGWDEVVDCMTTMMARWDVRVTDEDPGAAPHYEIVIAGSPSNLGMPASYGGVAPFSSQCTVLPDAIVYTFAEVFGTHYRAICEVASQEIAHAFGLDHEYLCEDPMSYLHGCGPKSFQAVEARCGEYEPRDCACGAPTQSSVAMLDARIGLAGEGNSPPEVEILAPADGARVPPGFTVRAAITDNAGLARVELRIDGGLVATAEGEPYDLVTPTSLAEGEHTVEVRATDDALATTAATITVTVDAAAAEGYAAPGSSGGCRTGAGGGLAIVGVALAALVGRRRYARPA